MSQKDAVKQYLYMGKNYDEIQILLGCPKASIRGRKSELKRQYGLTSVTWESFT